VGLASGQPLLFYYTLIAILIMRVIIDIRDDIAPNIALECVKQVIARGRISGKNNDKFCWLTTFTCKNNEEIVVYVRDYRKSDCFLVYLNDKKNNITKEQIIEKSTGNM